MQINMSGAIAGTFEVAQADLCSGSLSGDPKGINYVLTGLVPGGPTRDVGIVLNFSVHRYSKPGTFTVGTYPDGTAGAPAVASVQREITARNILTWTSGSGSLIVDPGARSGTLDVQLTSTSGGGALAVSGSWVCPAGS